MKIVTRLNPSPSEIRALEKRLFRYNGGIVENYAYKDFLLEAQDENNGMAGGIYCQIGGNWLYIESLWVLGAYRRQGLGRQLLVRAEEIGRTHGCLGAYLYTYGFQSPEFYRILGYDVFGRIENFWDAYPKLYMKKKLLPEAPPTTDRWYMIQKAGTDDSPGILALSDQLGYPGSESAIRKRLHLIQNSEDDVVFIARSKDGEVMAWIHACRRLSLQSGVYAEISGLVVSERFQRKGIGRDLVEKVEKWSMEKGLSRLRVKSQVKRDGAKRFYSGLGFSITKEQQVLDKALVLPSESPKGGA